MDDELVEAGRRGRANVDADDRGSGRPMRPEIPQERVHSLRLAFQVDLDAIRPVQNPAPQRVGAREAVDERTKADALHHAANPDRPRTRSGGYPGMVHPRPCQPT
jgi:hypothetical protein